MTMSSKLNFGVVVLAVLATAPLMSSAQAPQRDCFKEAAERFSVDERLLRAIAKVESNFNPAALHVNTDGTLDVGMMQINSSHFGSLRAYGIDQARLIAEPCVNVAVGAWILAGFIRQHGLTWRAVGSYAAGNRENKEGARIAYATLVSRALKRVAPDAGSKQTIVASNQPVRKMQVVD